MSPRSSIRQAPSGPGALDILEEVFHLLRRAPLSTLAAYYVGSLPFVLGLVFFWTDMAKSAFARDRVLDGALVLALLFVWMKTWQSAYARRLWAQKEGLPAPRWTWRHWARAAFRQTLLQPLGLFLLPIALMILAPFGWVYAWYQNVTVIEDGERGDAMTLARGASDLATLWPMQNHVLIWAISPYMVGLAFAFYLVLLPIAMYQLPDYTAPSLSLLSGMYFFMVMPLSPFGVVVAANIAQTLGLLPELLRMFTGIETEFVRSGGGLWNSTFGVLVGGLTYLCLDPLVKAAYTLRCFYGEAVTSGADLRADLGRALKRGGPVLLALTAGVVALAGPSFAEETAGDAASTAAVVSRVAPGQLDQALDRVLQDPRYAWRLPRERAAIESEGPLLSFVRGVFETLRNGVRKAWEWAKKLGDWLFPSPPDLGDGIPRFGFGLNGAVQVLLYILLAVLLALFVVKLMRARREQNAESTLVPSALAALRADIEDETVTADALPEERWLELARQLAEHGEFRLAVRAAFLASLAGLGRHRLISIAPFKTNRDYARELARRAHAHPGLPAVLGDSTAAYESVWYGRHGATAAMLDIVLANQERLRALGQE